MPMAGIGPATSPLPRECSTTEPHGRFNSNSWSGRRGSNSRHLAWKASALPTELHPQTRQITGSMTIIYVYWWRGKDSNLRTLRERIYSPSPLTTRPPLQTEPKIMLIFLIFVKPIRELFQGSQMKL